MSVSWHGTQSVANGKVGTKRLETTDQHEGMAFLRHLGQK